MPSLARSGASRGAKGSPSSKDAREVLAAMNTLKLEERGVEGLEERILGITQRYQRKAYDGTYLALAEHEGAPLITGDERLYNAVKGELPWVRWIGEYKAIAEKRPKLPHSPVLRSGSGPNPPLAR